LQFFVENPPLFLRKAVQHIISRISVHKIFTKINSIFSRF